MSLNPYLPPSHTENSADDPLRPKQPRPIAVWLFELYLTGLVIWGLVGIIKYLRFAITGVYDFFPLSSLSLGTAITWRIVVSAGFIFCIINSHKGKKSGRWTGILIFAAMILVQFWILGAPQEATGNSAAQSGAAAGGFFAILLYGYWTFAFGFSKKAKRYFGVTENKPD